MIGGGGGGGGRLEPARGFSANDANAGSPSISWKRASSGARDFSLIAVDVHQTIQEREAGAVSLTR